MSTPLPDIQARFAILIAGLCRLVAAHIADDRTAADWIRLVWGRISRIGQRVERLAAQVRAGTVPKRRKGYALTTPRKPATRPPIVLPRNPLWLVQRIQQTAVYGDILRRILDDPDMAALLAAAPQLARVLRPLCRALGVTPPPLPPRPASPEPAPPDAAAPLAAAPAAPPEPARPPQPPRARAAPPSPGLVLKPA